jgi:uncharacterized protein (TIGR03032 family)
MRAMLGSSTATAQERLSVAVSFEYSINLPQMLEDLQISVLLSTYQAGQVVSIGSHQSKLQVGLSHFDQAMGLCRTPSGIAVGSRDAIWTLPANRAIAPRIEPADTRDIAFLARQAHYTGVVMGHDLGWAGERIWLVNTLFNGLVTIEDNWSFVPQWKPPFISAWAPGDRCHLNGMSFSECSSSPTWVTALGETDAENGWRESKATGGCLIHVSSDEIVTRGLSMPHSPRHYIGSVYLLDSGKGKLVLIDQQSGASTTVAALPGFTRGLDFYEGYAFVGLSQVRETAVFGDLPLQQGNSENLRCGLAVVNLRSGSVDGMFWFHSGIEEIFSVLVLPGWKNPALIGPDTRSDASQTVWVVPQVPVL